MSPGLDATLLYYAYYPTTTMHTTLVRRSQTGMAGHIFQKLLCAPCHFLCLVKKVASDTVCFSTTDYLLSEKLRTLSRRYYIRDFQQACNCFMLTCFFIHSKMAAARIDISYLETKYGNVYK